MPLLFLAFLLIPLAEIYVLLEVGSIIGALPTIALVVFTAVAGAWLIRAQGFSTLARAQSELNAGALPAIPILEGAFLLVAGALMLTPGFITDTVGFLCLLPPLRQWLIQRFILSRFDPTTGTRRGSFPGRPREGTGPTVIEGEYQRRDDPPHS